MFTITKESEVIQEEEEILGFIFPKYRKIVAEGICDCGESLQLTTVVTVCKCGLMYDHCGMTISFE